MSPQPAPGHAHAVLDRTAHWLVFGTVLATLFVPRLTHAAVIALAVLPVAMLAMAGHRRSPSATFMTPLGLAAIAFGIYVAINAGWSVNRAEAYGKVLYYWVLALTIAAAARGLEPLDDGSIERASRAVLTAIAIGAAFLLVEVVSNLWLHRQLANAIPALRPSGKHMSVANDMVVHIGEYFVNRSFAVLSLALWPAILIARSITNGGWRYSAAIGLYAVTALAVFKSQHETSMLALVLSGIAFGGMLIAARSMRPLIAAGWCIATLLVVPIAMWSYQNGLHEAKWIPDTGRHRIVLWNVAAERVVKAPLLGVGVAATKEIDDLERPTAETRAGHSFPQRTGRHSHNVFMQTWYELGAIGAVLLMLLGGAALHWMWRLPPKIQPYAFASFVAAVMTGAFSYGLWQTWFLGAFGIWALTLAVAVEQARRQG